MTAGECLRDGGQGAGIGHDNRIAKQAAQARRRAAGAREEAEMDAGRL